MDLNLSSLLKEYKEKITEGQQKVSNAYLQNTEDITALEPLIDLQNKITAQISIFYNTHDIPDYILSKEDDEIFVYDKEYLEFLQRIRWPLFLENNKRLRKSLIPFMGMDNSLDEIRDVVFKYYSEDVVDGIKESWGKVLNDDTKRLAILNEAVTLYKQGCYYASTALLMSHVCGLINAMNEMAKDMETNQSYEKEVVEYFMEQFNENDYEKWKKDIEKDGCERRKLLKIITLVEDGHLNWEAVTVYIKDVILTSKDDSEIASHNPLRNKILHGIQLNYGTKEHSLKAILTIDLLIHYYDEISNILSIKKDDEEKCDLVE